LLRIAPEFLAKISTGGLGCPIMLIKDSEENFASENSFKKGKA